MTVDIYSPTPGDALSLEELQFYHLINDYRVQQGLNEIQISKSLTTVGGRHAQDVLYNIWEANLSQPAGSSLHSWSDAPYPDDNSQPQVMWEAPQRLGTEYVDPNIDPNNPNQREDRGYELTVAGAASVQDAFDAFIGSAPHLSVIANQDPWDDFTWNAIGFGVESDPSVTTFDGRIYHIWFGAMVDPAGSPDLEGDSGDNTIRGTAFDDALNGFAGDDNLNGGAGTDTVEYDREHLSGGTLGIVANLASGTVTDTFGDTDTLTSIENVTGSGFADTIAGDANANTLIGNDGDDMLTGGAGNDILSDGAGDDTVLAGAGNDTLNVGTGNDTYNGGTEIDTLVEDLTGQTAQSFVVELNLNTGDHGQQGDAQNRDTIIAIENYTLIGDFNSVVTGNGGANVFTTSFGSDTISAAAGDDVVRSGSGDDTVDGGGGADQLYGEQGNDTLIGGFANDLLFGGSGNDDLSGGDSNDQLFGGSGADIMDGGNGSDVFFIDAFDTVTDTGASGYDKAQINAGAGVSVTLTGWSGVERVNGFTGNDTVDGSSLTGDILLFGSDGNDALTGGAGNDVLIGGNGDDTLIGGAGDDQLLGNAGNDTFEGGAGNDVFFVGETGDVVTDGGADFDKVVVTDTNGITLSIGAWLNVERINGLTGDDTIDATGMSTGIIMSGSAGNDILTGGTGDDTFYGGADNDTLMGQQGADALIGASGDDRLDGGAGNDFYLGGAGADVFVWTNGFGQDVVKDYIDGTDRLDFTGHSGVTGLADLVVAQNGNNTVITLAAGGTDQITLIDTVSTDVTGSDFDFL